MAGAKDKDLSTDTGDEGITLVTRTPALTRRKFKDNRDDIGVPPLSLVHRRLVGIHSQDDHKRSRINVTPGAENGQREVVRVLCIGRLPVVQTHIEKVKRKRQNTRKKN